LIHYLKKYLQLIVDVHTKFNRILEMPSYLNGDFPNMVKIFLENKKIEEDGFWTELVR